jgi:hypothetical protein
MAVNKGKTQVSDATPRIEYSGFKEMELTDVRQIQQLTEDFAAKVQGHGVAFDRIHVRCKDVHKVEHNQKFEMHVEVSSAKMKRAAETVDKNPFKALDLALKKLLVEIGKLR